MGKKQAATNLKQAQYIVPVYLGPKLYRKLIDESTKRKMAKQPNSSMTAIAREALEAGLAR